ncbi:MAG: hypothetical protein JXB13_02740 [Phycisphaerae bacterium]|nr:hypothetical protein [Phycisphaerae bacterium]
MKKVLMMAACAVLVTGVVANAGDVALSLVGPVGPQAPGTATLEVKALVTPTAGEGGLALFGFDLDVPAGVPLASNQATTTLTSFVKNEGLTNPAGFGGTLSGATTLLQIGGGQNTINYTGTSPAYPTGTVVAGVGLTEVTVATIVLDTSALANGDHVFQISNGFANLIDPASQPSAPPYTVSAANMLAGTPTYTLTIGVTPTDITIVDNVKSWKDHGTSVNWTGTKLGLSIPLAPQTRAPIETREGSVTELTFDTAPIGIDPLTLDPSKVTICGHVNTPPAPATATVSGTTVTLTWAAGAIPNGYNQASQHDHYTVVISDTVKSADGGDLTGDRDFDFAASFGNVRPDGVLGNWQNVNANDLSRLIDNYTTTPTAAQATQYDIRITGPANKGKINANDRSWLTSSYSTVGLIQAAPVCP